MLRRILPNLHVTPEPCSLLSLIVFACLGCSCIGLTTTNRVWADERTLLRSGDRVVMVGDGLIEQAQYSGWIETMLTAAHPEMAITFRNIGWSGDTPSGDSRTGLSLVQAGREGPGEGWRQLENQLKLTQPTLLIVGYGMASALESCPSVSAAGESAEIDIAAVAVEFRSQLSQITQAAKGITPDVRFVFLTPLKHLSATETQRQSLAAHRRVIEEIARESSSPVVELSSIANEAAHRQSAIRVSSRGYQAIAKTICKTLCPNRPVPNGEADGFERLRQIVLRKNEWWFHRSRPANMAYVFGFRRHEQGQNAGEIPQFDELIAVEEQRIRELADINDQPSIEIPEPRLKSAFAKFDEQPLPEFSVHPDWEISLWAQNPLLNKPIHMNFDEQGRLWVASSEAYPMIEVGQAAPDRIVVLEDTNGDGTADESAIFAEGLLIPTGVLPGDGGVYVAQSTDLLFLKDNDGDLKADEKIRMLSGFGTEDTHHNLHTLLWGPDGRLNMNQSVYTRSDLETPEGIVRLKAGGGLRLDTESLRTNVFFRGLWNSWGHRFDRYGQSFLTDGAGFAGVAYGFPGATFNPTPRARYQLDLISPGSWPKFASLEIIDGQSYPPEWQGSLVTCDFRANRVTRFSLTDDDAGFVTQQEADLVRTSAATFRPIDVKLGPDGCIYIADWSNPIINHGEVDFRDARRDRWHGRIWRLRWKGAEPEKKQDLASFETDSLIELVLEGDGYQRATARRILKRRNEAVAHFALRIDAIASKEKRAVATMEAMWLSQAQGQIDAKLLKDCLSASDGRVRAAAVRALGSAYRDDELPIEIGEWQSLLEGLLVDPIPRVRLEVVRALAEGRSVQNTIRSLDVLQGPMDRFLEHALMLNVNELAPQLVQHILDGSWPPADEAGLAVNAKKIEFIVTKIPPNLASGLLAKYLASHTLEGDAPGPWIELVAKAGGRPQLDQLFVAALSGKLVPAATVRALDSLGLAKRLRKMTPMNPSRIGGLLAADDDVISQSAARLIGTWNLKGQSAELAEIAGDAGRADALRIAAIGALGELRVPKTANVLSNLAGSPASSVQRAALRALTAVSPELAVQPFLAQLLNAQDDASAQSVWRNNVFGPQFAELLSDNLAQADLETFMVDAGRQVLSRNGEGFDGLKAVLESLGTQAQKLTYSPALVEKITESLVQADPHRGELVYRRSELACVSCHAIGGVGGKVGPDMTSLGASAPVDYIIESLVAPDAKIKEGYHSISIATEEGQVFTGIQVSADDSTLVLRDANGKLVEIPQVEIVGKKAAASLMPSGVVDRLSDQERADLVAFLSRLGKPGPFDGTKGGIARQFEVFAGTHRIEQQGAERITSGQIAQGWKPATSLVSGKLPKETLVKLTQQPRNIALVHVYARTSAQIAEPGEVTFGVNSPSAALWIDGQEVDTERTSGAASWSVELEPGTYSVLVRLDARDLPESLAVTASGVVFSDPANSTSKEGGR